MSTLRTLSRNLPYFQQQFIASIKNTSHSTKLICLIVVIGYILSYSDTVIDYLSITPGYVSPPTFSLWTLFTFCFIELHLWEVILDIVIIGLCGKLLEPLWGQLEMVLFFIVTNLGVAILSVISYFILYMCTFDTNLLFVVHVHGLAGYLAAVSVAIKQIIPDNILFMSPPLGKITNRNIPLICTLLAILCWLIGLVDGTFPVMFTNGVCVSWIYLRFYQRHSNGIKGDMSDIFSFSSFFPNVLQPPIAVLSNTIFDLFVRIGLCRKVVRRYDMLNPTGVTVSLPGIDPHDMERRRQIALKALNERLSKVNENRLGKSNADKTKSKIVQPKIEPPSSTTQQLNSPKKSTIKINPNTAFTPITPKLNVSPQTFVASVPTTIEHEMNVSTASPSVNINIMDT